MRVYYPAANLGIGMYYVYTTYVPNSDASLFEIAEKLEFRKVMKGLSLWKLYCGRYGNWFGLYFDSYVNSC